MPLIPIEKRLDIPKSMPNDSSALSKKVFNSFTYKKRAFALTVISSQERKDIIMNIKRSNTVENIKDKHGISSSMTVENIKSREQKPSRRELSCLKWEIACEIRGSIFKLRHFKEDNFSQVMNEYLLKKKENSKSIRTYKHNENLCEIPPGDLERQMDAMISLINSSEKKAAP